MLTLYTGNFTILTSYPYNKCSPDQEKALKQAALDANAIAHAGVKEYIDVGGDFNDRVDFSHEAAIDYFGPSSKNKDQQGKIFSESSLDETSSYLCRAFVYLTQPL